VFPLRDNVPTRQFPVVTAGLILANVLVYVLVERGGANATQASVDALAFRPCEVEGSCQTIGAAWFIDAFTSMFMHADWIHLGGNMLFLWIFGNNVEDALGRFRYLVFYLLAGLAATAAQTIVTLQSAPEMAARIPNLGASGAIAGVLGAYFILLPGARILTLIFLFIIFFIREIPAWVFLGVYFFFQAWEANFELEHPPAGGGVAVFAHVGGIAFGLATIALFRKREPLRPEY